MQSKRAGTGLAVLAVSALWALAVPADAHHRPFRAVSQADQGGLVYVMSNASDGNAILVYTRERSGRLHVVRGGGVPTGGAGNSVTAAVDPLGSQGSLIYDSAHDMLFAVNAGSDTVTGFSTAFFGLPLRWSRQLVPSGGRIPVSLAVLEDRLYVLNAGETGTVATFEIGSEGGLSLVDSYDLGLSPKDPALPFDPVNAPGQVGVDALGRRLLVTDAGDREILAIALDDAGVPSGPIVTTPSPGIVPFAFDVTPYGSILVAEAGSGAVSAYDSPSAAAPLELTAASVGTGQAATCWIAVHPGGFAYVSNTGSGTLSVFTYTRTGGLALLDDVAATPDGAPIDLTLAGGGGFLYSLDAASGQISGFAVDAETGALELVETENGLPAAAGIQGIAARDY